MRWLELLNSALKAMEDGRVIRKAVAVGLRVMAALVALLGVYVLVKILTASFQSLTTEDRTMGEVAMGGLIFGALWVATVACVVQILRYRAASVAALGDSPFTVIPIVSILLRTAGEIYGALGLGVGIGGCVFMWLAGSNPLDMLGPVAELLPSGGRQMTFWGGILFLVTLTLTSVLVIAFSYFVAESVLVVVDIARNVRLLVATVPGDNAPGPVASRQNCLACGAELEADAVFCWSCGARAQPS